MGSTNGAMHHDVIVLGASAGGLATLTTLLADLPADLPAAVCVVLHRAADFPSYLAELLGRQSPLPVISAEDRQPLERGRVYVAPADRHLLIEADRLRVVRGPKENRHRPAIDPLFRSAGYFHGPRVVAGILTGTLDDGGRRGCGR